MSVSVPPAPKATFVPVITEPAPAVAAPVAAPEDASPPGFVLGFAFLKQQLGPIMGDPLESEQPSPDSCDTLQRTSTGLAYWRCSTNMMSFVSQDSGGLVHWAWLNQLLTWHGDAVDPPGDATVFSPTADVPQQLDAACVLPGATVDNACPLANGMSVSGYIDSSGQSNAYRFDVTGNSMHVTADLTNLPADYDLYLVDSAGSQLGASLEEGTLPEEVDITLGPGTYYLFVHSDPGRTVDGNDPYTLQLTIAPESQNTAAALPIVNP